MDMSTLKNVLVILPFVAYSNFLCFCGSVGAERGIGGLGGISLTHMGHFYTILWAKLLAPGFGLGLRLPLLPTN
jgi:hypothetical protein